MKNFRRFVSLLLKILIGVALFLSLSCGDKVPSDGKATPASEGAKPQPANPTKTSGDKDNAESSSSAIDPPGLAFDPALLLSSKQTLQFAVAIPEQSKDPKDKRKVIKVLLDSRSPYILTLRIVAECATLRAQKELQSKIPEMKAAVIDHISSKTPESITSTQGRMKLKEEILLLMQRQMSTKAIKQVYFTEYFVAPGKI